MNMYSCNSESVKGSLSPEKMKSSRSKYPGCSYSKERVEHKNYIRNLLTGFDSEYNRRREAEKPVCDEVLQPDANPLVVELSGFYPRENAKEHRTDMYELVLDEKNPTPVFRRGLPFYFAVRFNRKFDFNHDIVHLVFTFGPKPNVTKKTLVILPVTDRTEMTADKKSWDLCINSQSGKNITFQIKIPVTAQVGIWRCRVQTNHKGYEDLKNDFLCKENMYVLFNPWCEDDAVFLPDDSLRQEYILNENGKIWGGTHLQPNSRHWVFGQFDDTILPVVIYLLELSQLKHVDRGNPVLIAKAISTIIASKDGSGLLAGRWDGIYDDGIAPHMWTGSVAIFEKFLQNGGQPIQYGQCWVFSAVAVSVFRALGIPCRSVTNYMSARDNDSSHTVDTFFSKGCDLLEECSDSSWNFHAWNEVWMMRPDLPAGYGGWQIVDPTPQEENNVSYGYGPASLLAVRKGELGFTYDTSIIFAEVNAELRHFQENENSYSGVSRLWANKHYVGKRIVTKRHDKNDFEGDSDLEDITHLYKNHEVIHPERIAIFNAMRSTSRDEKDYDVHFDLVPVEKIFFGQSFSVTVHIQNKADQPRTIFVTLSASTIFYTGNTAHRLRKAQKEFVVNPRQRETLQITVTADEYLEKVVDKSLVKVYAVANVKETKQAWSKEDDFPFQKPALNIQVHGALQVGQLCQASFTFQNPLPITLTDCIFSVEGRGLLRPKFIRYKAVSPGELVTFTEQFRPKKDGTRRIVGVFNSKQLTELMGSITMYVNSQ